MKFLLLMILSANIITAQFQLVADGCKFPEGPAWNGEKLVVSNCYGDWITQVKGSKVDTFVQIPTEPVSFEKTNGLTFYKDGSLFAAEFGFGAILRFDENGKCEIYVDGYNGEKFNRPNDLAFDSEGDLYFTDPKNYDAQNPDGTVYLIRKETKEVIPVFQYLAFPNGIALDAEEEYLYVCESAKNRVLKYEINEDKTLGEFEVFAELPGGDPDGIAFDVEGNLYVAHFGGSAIQVFSPEGELIKKIKTPGTKPSNVEFGGEDMKTLFITEDETNSIYKMENEIAGMKLFSSPLRK